MVLCALHVVCLYEVSRRSLTVFMSSTDTILSQNCFLQSSKRGITEKIHIQKLWLLCSTRCLMLLNTCMKFYEHILKVLKLQNGHDFVTETATYKVQRDVTQKVSYKSYGSRTLHVV